jgi:hypothetical protein
MTNEIFIGKSTLTWFGLCNVQFASTRLSLILHTRANTKYYWQFALTRYKVLSPHRATYLEKDKNTFGEKPEGTQGLFEPE